MEEVCIKYIMFSNFKEWPFDLYGRNVSKKKCFWF